jgi:hypothetical protein
MLILKAVFSGQRETGIIFVEKDFISPQKTIKEEFIQ